MVCGGACVNTMTDPQACGSCVNQCATGDTCGAGGMCQCAGQLCQQNQICADVQHDPLACGGCNTQCNSRQFCAGGTCTCRPGFQLCNAGGGMQCTETDVSFTNCGACGNNCGNKGFQNPHCVAGVCVDSTCQALGMTTCQGACLSDAQLGSDPRNCGQCGNTCAANEVCSSGNCQAYFTAPGCNACPCAACGAGTTCCSFPGGNFPVCVQGNACP
jgi:hypothetical protein